MRLYSRTRIILQAWIYAFNFTRKAMPIYSNEMTQEVIIREFAYAFADKKYPGLPEMELNTISTEPFVIGDIQSYLFLCGI